MSEFNIEDLDAVIASAESSLVQMLALQLKGQIRKYEQLAKEREAFTVECAAAKIALKYALTGRRDFTLATPATDAYLAGIKSDGRVEGVNFAASRLAAAFNHGFVDKPMAEVFDVVRMILDAKADLANSPTPPEDGLSGEYAEKSLAEWEAELREGADK